MLLWFFEYPLSKYLQNQKYIFYVLLKTEKRMHFSPEKCTILLNPTCNEINKFPIPLAINSTLFHATSTLRCAVCYPFSKQMQCRTPICYFDSLRVTTPPGKKEPNFARVKTFTKRHSLFKYNNS